jgi:hypothetical protein
LRHWLNATLAKSWTSWEQHVAWRKEKRNIMKRWQAPLLVRA